MPQQDFSSNVVLNLGTWSLYCLKDIKFLGPVLALELTLGRGLQTEVQLLLVFVPLRTKCLLISLCICRPNALPVTQSRLTKH